MGEEQNDEGRPPVTQAARLARQASLAAIGEIAAEVAHELRNSLQIIAANVYLAKQDATRSGSAEGYLLKIERSARIAQGIVDDLMALARAEPTHAEPVALAVVISAAREDLPAGSERVTFHEQIEPVGLEVMAHPGLLARCLHVLYENATHAGATQITTRAHLDASLRSVIEVTDDGPGVPKEVASTIFDPLVTARAGGTGLGLALAKRIAAAHDGSIVLVDSDVGATFRIELPA